MSFPAAFQISAWSFARHLQCRIVRRLLSVIAGVLLVMPIHPECPAAADNQSAFSLSRLSIEGELQDLLTEDLNADSLGDIMIVHRKGLEPNETRWISIFWQRENGGFSTAPDQSWEIDTAAVILDLGDVSGNAGKEICYLTADAVRCYSLESRTYKTASTLLFTVTGITAFPDKREIPNIDFVRDWNGDGSDEVCVFKFEGLSIFSRGSSDTFSKENRIPMSLETGMSRGSRGTEDMLTSGLIATYRYPDIRLIDYDADGDKDLIAATDDHLIVCRLEPDGNFSTKHGEDVLFDVRTQREKIEASAELSTVVTDLNNDNRADAIVTKQTSKGLTSFRGVVNIYYGKDGGYSKKPDQLLVSEGTASAGTLIRDVNGDGRQDLVFPSVDISITSIIRVLLTKSLPIKFNIFLLNTNNKFPDKPDFTKEVKLKIDFSGQSDAQAMDIDGDYNGDKRKDFIFATAENELSIYLGIKDSKEMLFSNKPVAKVSADAYGELSSPDLNNDGYSDIVIYYTESKERKGLVEVLINQRKIQ